LIVDFSLVGFRLAWKIVFASPPPAVSRSGREPLSLGLSFLFSLFCVRALFHRLPSLFHFVFWALRSQFFPLDAALFSYSLFGLPYRRLIEYAGFFCEW